MVKWDAFGHFLFHSNLYHFVPDTAHGAIVLSIFPAHIFIYIYSVYILTLYINGVYFTFLSLLGIATCINIYTHMYIYIIHLSLSNISHIDIHMCSYSAPRCRSVSDSLRTVWSSLPNAWRSLGFEFAGFCPRSQGSTSSIFGGGLIIGFTISCFLK